MLKRGIVCFFLFQFIFIPNNYAQRFGGGFKLAGTLSQIDGDDVYGFNKLGFEAGVYGRARLSKITDLEIHFSYNQRGSRSTADDPLLVKINLNYIDIPILFVIKDWLISQRGKEYYRMHFFGGLSLGRLISSNSVTKIDEDFNKTDLSWILGTSYYYSGNWGVSAKYSRSLNSLYDSSKVNQQVKMISYFISLGLIYKFN